MIVPGSVTDIGKYAFASNDNLKTVELPDSITEIKDGTFDDIAKKWDLSDMVCLGK